MIDLDDGVYFADPNKDKVAGEVARDCSAIVCQHYDLTKKVEHGVDAALNNIGQELGSMYAQVDQRIAETPAVALQKMLELQDKVDTYLGAHIVSIEGILQTLTKKVEAWEAKQRNAQRRAEQRAQEKANPQKPAGGGPPPPQSPAAQIVPVPPAASSSGSAQAFDPFPPPPSPAMLTNVYIPINANNTMLGLSEMPVDWWQPNHDLGWFFSMQPTPLSRAQIPTINVDGDNVTTNPPAFFNTSTNLTNQGIGDLLAQMGIGPDDANVLTLDEAWSVLGDAFGPTLVAGVWDHFGFPHAPVAEPLRPIHTYTPEHVQELIREQIPPDEPLPVGYPEREPPKVPGNGFISFPGVEFGTSTPISGGTPVPPENRGPIASLPQMPGIGQALQAAAGILPGGFDLCTFMQSLAPVAGCPPALMPPCATLPQIAAHNAALFRRLRLGS